MTGLLWAFFFFVFFFLFFWRGTYLYKNVVSKQINFSATEISTEYINLVLLCHKWYILLNHLVCDPSMQLFKFMKLRKKIAFTQMVLLLWYVIPILNINSNLYHWLIDPFEIRLWSRINNFQSYILIILERLCKISPKVNSARPHWRLNNSCSATGWAITRGNVDQVLWHHMAPLGPVSQVKHR